MLESWSKSWFASGAEESLRDNQNTSPEQLRNYEKYKFRLMETGGDLLYELLALAPHDHDIAELCSVIEAQVVQEEGTNLGNRLLLNHPPRGTQLTTERAIYAGSMPSGDSLPLPESRWSCGTAITGLPGSCKTTLAMLLNSQLVFAGSLIFVWDIKRTWRKLLNFPLLLDKVIVLSVLDFVWSLLQPPPGTEIREWANRFTNVLAQAYGRISAQRILREVIDDLLAVCPTGCWPTPIMLIDRLKALRTKSPREREYVSSMLWVITDLVKHIPCFEYTSSNFPKCLLEPGRLVIIEDNGLPVQHWNFLICMLQEWIFTYRRNNPDERKFDIIHVLEDSTALLDSASDRNTPGGVSLVAQNLNTSREMRIALWPICHSLSQISRKILPNIESFFVCSLRGDDLRFAQQILGIRPETAEFMRVNPRGTACALVPSVWPLPVMVSFPPLKESLK